MKRILADAFQYPEHTCFDARSAIAGFSANEILKNGIDIASVKIEFRSAVDFPYYDKCPQDCRCGGALHLNLRDGILERVWVFKVAHNDDARLILYGHTFLPWSQRKDEAPENRADRLIPLNWRLATHSKKGVGNPIHADNPFFP